MPTFRSHTIDIIGDCGEKGLMCEIHPQEALELYCETCGVLTCRDCQLSLHRDHGGHRWVKEKAELIRPSLTLSIKSMESQVEKLRSYVESTKNSPSDILASVELAKAAHQRAIDDLIRIAKAKKADFEDELDEVAQEHVGKLHAATAIMQSLAVCIHCKFFIILIFLFLFRLIDTALEIFRRILLRYMSKPFSVLIEVVQFIYLD